MVKKVLRIATRKSQLALTQAEWVRNKLTNTFAGLEVEILPIQSSGDKFLQAPLYKIGGKGLFVKELDEAILSKRADIAVHSAKDIPQTITKGLSLACITQRENPFDAWICPKGMLLQDLPSGAKVGTSSLRRMVQLKAIRNDLDYVPLRGNVITRLKKCHSGEFDAIVLAQAGINRLGLQNEVMYTFKDVELLPAVGQGALGIVCLSSDLEVQKMLSELQDNQTNSCVMAERQMNAKLNGSCQVPIAGYATLNQDKLTLNGLVGDPMTNSLLQAEASATLEHSASIGLSVADALIEKGALDIIQKLTDLDHG